MKELLDYSYYYTALFFLFLFFSTSLHAAFKARVLLQISQSLLEKGESIWRNYKLANSNSSSEPQSCLFHTICIQLNEFNVVTTFHMRNDIFICIFQEGPSLDTAS